jgi:hypothetical protein
MFAALLSIVDRVAVHPRLVGAFSVVACASNPSIVIWCTSGLENALYAFGVLTLAAATVRALDSPSSARTWTAAGILASLVALTRPEGLLFGLVPPALARATRRWEMRTLRLYAATFGGIFAVFLAARYEIFGHLLPNTALAKGRATELPDVLLLTSRGLQKLDRVLEGAFGDLAGNVVFVAAIVGARFVARKGRPTPALFTLLAYTGTALAAYMLMPSDWMVENRFATAFFPLYYASVFALLDRSVDLALPVGRSRRRPIAVGALAGAMMCVSLPDHAGRALLFASNSNISLDFVRRAFAERLDRFAALLAVPSPSALLPDVGAMLIWSHLRVYDLAGLCDEPLARMRTRDRAGAREYVLGAIRPTFIHTYGKWSLDLERDPRFERDYVAIHEYDRDEDPEAEGHATGLFVRREAAASPEGAAALEAIRSEPYRRNTFRSDPRPSFFLRWLETTPLVPREYRLLVERSGGPDVRAAHRADAARPPDD